MGDRNRCETVDRIVPRRLSVVQPALLHLRLYAGLVKLTGGTQNEAR
jgi:hypothetical protein